MYSVLVHELKLSRGVPCKSESRVCVFFRGTIKHMHICMFVNVPDPIMEFNADMHSTFASLPCTAYFLWLKWSVYELQDSFHRGGTISDITDQICSLNASLHSYDSPTQLVVDKYMKDHGLEVEPDEEEFGFGKLLIDYKPPKTSTAKISNKGKIFEFSVLVMARHSIPNPDRYAHSPPTSTTQVHGLYMYMRPQRQS